jgi:hypothetical protein
VPWIDQDIIQAAKLVYAGDQIDRIKPPIE